MRLNTITAVVMALNVGFLLFGGFLAFGPVNLADVKNEPFPVRPYEVKRGETLEYFVHFEKFRTYDAISNRNIICDDGNLVTMSPKPSSAPIGEHETWTSIVVPQKVSDGRCYLQMENTYYINPLRTEHRTLRTDYFFVVK